MTMAGNYFKEFCSISWTSYPRCLSFIPAHWVQIQVFWEWTFRFFLGCCHITVSISKFSQGMPVFTCTNTFTKLAKICCWWTFLVLYFKKCLFHLPATIFPSTVCYSMPLGLYCLISWHLMNVRTGSARALP